MAELFESIASGYFQPFGNLTPEQEQCKNFTKENLGDLTCAQQREKFIDEIRVCIAGFGPADEGEPLEDGNFSQFQFFKPFTETIIYFVDKFDFLVNCVAHGVCKVARGFEDRYMHALLQVLTFRELTVPESPEWVLDLRTVSTPRTVKEQMRSEAQQQQEFEEYVERRHTYGKQIRGELADLEKEQYLVEKARGEHKSLMGWEDTDRIGEHPANENNNNNDAKKDEEPTEELTAKATEQPVTKPTEEPMAAEPAASKPTEEPAAPVESTEEPTSEPTTKPTAAEPSAPVAVSKDEEVQAASQQQQSAAPPAADPTTVQ